MDHKKGRLAVGHRPRRRVAGRALRCDRQLLQGEQTTIEARAGSIAIEFRLRRRLDATKNATREDGVRGCRMNPVCGDHVGIWSIRYRPSQRGG